MRKTEYKRDAVAPKCAQTQTTLTVKMAANYDAMKQIDDETSDSDVPGTQTQRVTLAGYDLIDSSSELESESERACTDERDLKVRETQRNQLDEIAQRNAARREKAQNQSYDKHFEKFKSLFPEQASGLNQVEFFYKYCCASKEFGAETLSCRALVKAMYERKQKGYCRYFAEIDLLRMRADVARFERMKEMNKKKRSKKTFGPIIKKTIEKKVLKKVTKSPVTSPDKSPLFTATLSPVSNTPSKTSPLARATFSPVLNTTPAELPPFEMLANPSPSTPASMPPLLDLNAAHTQPQTHVYPPPTELSRGISAQVLSDVQEWTHDAQQPQFAQYINNAWNNLPEQDRFVELSFKRALFALLVASRMYY